MNAKLWWSTTTVFGMALGASTVFAADPVDSGNRWNLPRFYHSEISVAEAFVKAELGQGHARDDEAHKPIIIDVRTINEYRLVGHPEKAVNIPYPHIYGTAGQPGYIAQDPKTFFDAVAARVPDRGRWIFLLCRTGQRSVLAANILSAPGKYIPGYETMDGFIRVRNIWEGFEGVTKVDANLKGPLDLDNDGYITDGDKDGWKNYAGLPYTHELKPDLIYKPFVHLYPR